MSDRDEAAADAAREEVRGEVAACLGDDRRREWLASVDGDAIAKKFGGSAMRRVVGRGPTNRDWRAFIDAANAEIERQRANFAAAESEVA